MAQRSVNEPGASAGVALDVKDLSATAVRTGGREYTVVIPAGKDELYAIYAQPEQPSDRPAVVLLTGGGHKSMMGRNRTWVRLARQLAARGFPVLRFDYHGVCESTGTVDEFWLENPFVADLEGVANWLRARRMTGLVLVGECFGARTALAAAEHLPELRAVVLLSVPLRGYRWGAFDRARDESLNLATAPAYIRRTFRLKVLRRILDSSKWRARYRRMLAIKVMAMRDSIRDLRTNAPRRQQLWWVSPMFLRQLGQIVRRRVHVLLLYGTEEDDYADFCQALNGELGRIVGEADGTLRIQTVEGVLHAFTRVRVQEAAIEATVQWITDIAGPRDQTKEGHRA